jgi:RimJ/RimL family protein N-acetyltransferase
MREVSCVGAFVRDDMNRVYVHRRTPDRRVYPGVWDVVGGHLDAGEAPEQALARELEEETGWRLRRIEAVIADWEWEWDGVVRRELDYLVEVDGDLAEPRLEDGKHDACAWVGRDNLELLMEGRTDGDRRLRDIVAKVARTRLTDRLRLEPAGPGHAHDLVRLHDDETIAAWHAGRWGLDEATTRAGAMGAAWERDGVSTWMAYHRASGELVGRGGLSRMAAGSDLTRQVAAALPGAGWAADRLELGWAVLSTHQGQGHATEIGRAGLAFAFDELGAQEVVAFTERHNARSRAVMERLGMRQVRDILGEGLIEGLDGVRPAARFALYARPRT